MSSRETNKHIVATARELLSGSVGIIEACRSMVPMLSEVDEPLRSSEAVLVLIAVESETDEFPVGPQRQHWAADILRERDHERDAYLAKVRKDVEDSCRTLIAELGEPHVPG